MPNAAILLTVSRVIVAPIFALVFIAGFREPSSVPLMWAAVGLAVLIELSDFFDGRIARRQDTVTAFGKLVDPMADSLSRQTVFISFLVVGIIPLWVFLIFLYRDSAMATLRTMIAVTGRVQAAKLSGKLKAGVQAVAIFVVLAVCVAHVHNVAWVPRSLWGRHPGFWVMVPAALVTFVSALDYLVPNRNVIRKMMERSGDA